MPRKRFQDKRVRKGFWGIIFPYSTSRSGLIIRSLIIVLLVGIPLRFAFKQAELRAHDLDAEAAPIINTITNLENDIRAEDRDATQEEIWLYRSLKAQLQPYPKKMYMCATVMGICIALSAVQYILSIWMLAIPRLRDMGHSPKYAWFMIVPGANVILPWFLLLAPSK